MIPVQRLIYCVLYSRCTLQIHLFLLTYLGAMKYLYYFV